VKCGDYLVIGSALTFLLLYWLLPRMTGAKRDEQKNTETTEPAICSHDGTKLPENRRSHKRFSHEDK
jgi:hypothetical protein